MSRLLTNRRLFILLASFILLIVVAGLTLRDNEGIAAWPERVAMDAENAIGAVIYRPVSTVTSFLGGIHSLHEMYVENAQLKSEVQNYEQLKAQLQDDQDALKQLNRMVGFKRGAGSQLKPIPAHVVGRDPSQWNSEITVDVGTADNVKNNMAVIAIDGSLVGRVTLAARYSSKVVLITDTQVGDGVSARVQNNLPDQPFGVIMGSTTANGQLDMNFLSPLAQVKPGDTVVTSGLSDIFPPGLLIGKVVQVRPGLQGVTQSAIVQPTADLNYMQNVWVVPTAGNTR